MMFAVLDLVTALQQVAERVPGATLCRSGNGTGNLCIFNAAGTYVGVIELHDPPEVTLFTQL